jgi:hypothetical protein
VAMNLPKPFPNCRVGAPWKKGPLNVTERTYAPLRGSTTWRTPRSEVPFERASFFLLEEDGCNFTSSRQTFTKLLAGRPMQEVRAIG